MKEAIEKSTTYFYSGFGCAESVLNAVAEYKGYHLELIPRMATGFNGSMSNTNGNCGAVAGAILSLNIIYGRDRSDQSNEENYKAVQTFIKKFRKKFGDITCPGLTEIDLGSEEGYHSYNQNNMHATCAKFVGESTRMVLEIS